MDSNLIEKYNSKVQEFNNNYISLNTNSTNNSETTTNLNKNDKIKQIILKIINHDNSKNLKSKFFNKWKNIKKKSNLRSITIMKFGNKKIKFDAPTDSVKKNSENKNPLEGKININLLKRLINKQDDKLKYFFEKWKNLKYINKSRNYNIRKREIKKLKILPKKNSSGILNTKKDDDIYNNIIIILNKLDKSIRKKEILNLLKQIDELENIKELKTSNSNDIILLSKEGKEVTNLKNKITERTFKRFKNAIEKNDIKQKFFNKWKKLTMFKIKSNKSIRRINRIILTRKQKDLYLSDYDVKSYKTYDNIIDKKNELNNYIIPLYKKSNRVEQNHIKNTILKILNLLEYSKIETATPSTPFNDSSLSFSFVDINTDKNEEESLTNRSNKSISRRIYQKLKMVFEKKEIKMIYFERWRKKTKFNSKRNIKRIVLNKKEKDVILERFKSSNIFSRNKKNDIKSQKIKNAKSDEIIINEKSDIKKEEQNKNNFQGLSDYLNSDADFNDLDNYGKDDNLENKINKFKKEKINFEKIRNSEITPKKYRNSNIFQFNTDFKIDNESSSEKLKKVERYSATPGRYKLNFKKVILTRSKTKNSSCSKKSLNNRLIHIFKNNEKKYIRKYFDIWKNNNLNNLEDGSEKDDEDDVFEIIKTGYLKLDNSKNAKSIINKEQDNTIKNKNSSLNGIYGLCFTEDYITNHNKEEYISIYGNEKSKKISDNIQPHFSDFLKAMNCSIASFNLFTFYSQFHDNKFLIKKKFLPIWRNAK